MMNGIFQSFLAVMMIASSFSSHAFGAETPATGLDSDLVCGISRKDAESALKTTALKIGEDTGWVQIPREGIAVRFLATQAGESVKIDMQLKKSGFALAATQSTTRGPYQSQSVTFVAPGGRAYTLVCGQ